MKNESKFATITLPVGFALYETQKSMSAREALKILTSDKQAEYTSVQLNKDENAFVFTKHSFFCNTCCSRTPAYDHIFKGYSPSAMISSEAAKVWISRQTASIDSDSDPEILELYNPMKDCDSLTCPKCGTRLHPFTGDFTDLIISTTPDVLSLECAYYENKSGMVKNEEIAGIEENEVFGKCISNRSNEYVYETIAFCFESGEVRTLVTLRSSSLVFINNGCTILPTPLAETIDKNAIVKSKLKFIFDEFWEKYGSARIPFSGNEITSSEFFLLTRYIGYKKSFYRNITLLYEKPHLRNNLVGDIEKRLHLQTDNIKLYSELSLPDDKKIKAFILGAPEYLLFHDRIKKLYKEIGPKALYRFLTENKDSFERLLHTYL